MDTSVEYTWPSLLSDLVGKKDLSATQISWAMDQIMSGQTPDAIISAFLVALHVKGETSDELQALAQGMLAKAESINVTRRAVDIVGTGGDLQNTVNISTMAAIVVAATGVPVIKHGNRSSSSASGSADVLEKLGVNLTMPIEKAAEAAQKVGITFLFAQVFHPAMRFVAPVRKTLGIPTAFNSSGPMTNPARVRSSAVGVANPHMAEKLAQVFAARGDHALVFRGSDGLDEITISGETTVWEAVNGTCERYVIKPSDFGFTEGVIADLRGGDAGHNAQVALDTLKGAQGFVRTAVVLNAAAALVAFSEDSAADFSERFKRAITEAEQAIDSGKALEVLENWIAFSQESSAS